MTRPPETWLGNILAAVLARIAGDGFTLPEPPDLSAWDDEKEVAQ